MRCNKRIPPNSFKHEGTHSHDENGVHFCDKKCQFCAYYCNLPHGHPQILHETTHGNMVLTEFTAENDEFEYKGHKLQIGDQGSFVLCNFYCKELGRHRHIDYCQSVEACKNGQQGHEVIHLDVPLKPNPDNKKDYVTHKLFWERTGFKDPYSAQEQAEFAKCDHECPDEDHNRQQSSNSTTPTKSYCELEIFHKPLNPLSSTSTGIGYISLDGHQFSCDNPNKREAAFHIIFVLDRSSSMSCNDRKPLENIHSETCRKIASRHNNRLGAVYSAVYSFMETRLTSQRNLTQGAINKDTISLILFNSSTIVPIENQPLSDVNKFVDIMVQHSASDGTNFDLAIQEAGLLVDKYYDPTKTNIIIFLSDGGGRSPDDRLENICRVNQQRGSLLYLYTILFGNDSKSRLVRFFDGDPSLVRMVNIAQKYLPANSPPQSLKCQYTETIDEIALASHFINVAESLRKHKPSLMKKKVY